MDNLENVLKDKGLTKTELSNRLGIAKQNLNRMLVNPQLSTMRRIADALDINVRDLFRGQDDDSLTALIEYRSRVYVAHSIDELTRVVEDIKSHA